MWKPNVEGVMWKPNVEAFIILLRGGKTRAAPSSRHFDGSTTNFPLSHHASGSLDLPSLGLAGTRVAS